MILAKRNLQLLLTDLRYVACIMLNLVFKSIQKVHILV